MPQQISPRFEAWLAGVSIAVVCIVTGQMTAADFFCDGKRPTDDVCGTEVRPCSENNGDEESCLDGEIRETFEDQIGTGFDNQGNPWMDFAKEAENDAKVRCTCKRTCGYDIQLGRCFVATTLTKPVPQTNLHVPDCHAQLEWRSYPCDPPGGG